MYPLRLSANPQGWRHFMARKSDAHFNDLAQKVWQRDQFCCQYCGVKIKEGLEIVNVNGEYTNHHFSNLTTACGFCTQCGFLESIGRSRYGGGTLVYLPELQQEYLNGFCYALFHAMSHQTEEEESAQRYYRSLNLRSHVVEEQLGVGMSDPSVFGQLLVESGVKPAPNTFIAGLRLLPSRTAFKNQIVELMISVSVSSENKH